MDDSLEIRLEPSLDRSLDLRLNEVDDDDDPFSDTAESASAFHSFSPASIRNDLAKNAETWKQEVEEVHRSGTNGIESNEDGFRTDIGLGNGFMDHDDSTFVSISLSNSHEGNEDLDTDSLPPTSPSPSPPSSPHPVEPSELTDEEEDVTGATEQDTPASYPSVVINISDKSHKVTVSTDNTEISSAPIPALPSNSHSRSSTSSSTNSAHSTQSLPAPSPSSATPTHPTFSAPTPSAPAAVSSSSSASTRDPGPSSLASSPATTVNLKPVAPHRPTRSVGPSALEKFRSKTRPHFLPPKSREEDNKHLADWEGMMKQSRNAAEKRRRALAERRLAREKKIEESLHIWEQKIVPDWRLVHKNSDLRKLWWKGIPTKLRSSMWEKAVGNPLALSKDNFRSCLSRANRALSNGSFSSRTLSRIESDISSTLPSLHIFHQNTGPLYSDLKDILMAWVVSRADEGLGYQEGVARVAGMLILNIDSKEKAFVVLRNLLERHILRSFFGGSGLKEDVEAYYRIFDTLLADGMPKIYFNFKQHQISPSSYLSSWIMPLFLDHLPFEACARIWDVILLEGDSFIFRVALGVLGVLEPRLFFPEKDELVGVLDGSSPPAIAAARRQGIPLVDVEIPDDSVTPDNPDNVDEMKEEKKTKTVTKSLNGIYDVYGIDEETLWERIDSMDGWWKLSTWERLIRRELPDL